MFKIIFILIAHNPSLAVFRQHMSEVRLDGSKFNPMPEQQTTIPISLYDHFPILRKEARVVEKPDAEDPETIAAVARLFDDDFVEDDVSIAMKKVGDQIVERVGLVPYTQTRELLIEFGVQVVPFLEQLYPEIATEDPHELPGRLAHTLVYAQNRLQVDQTSRGRLMTLGQRRNMHFEFSDKLTSASTTD